MSLNKKIELRTNCQRMYIIMNASKESNNFGRFSMKRTTKKGSFYHKLPVYDLSNSNDSTDTMTQFNSYKELRIDPLTEEEKEENWIRVFPKSLLIKNKEFKPKIKVNSSNKKFKRIKRYNVFDICLLELPNNLWTRLKWNYRDGEFYNYTVTDRIHKYSIYKTDYDEKIFELRKLIIHNSNKYDFDRIKEIVTLLKSENLSGWLLNKASKIVKKSRCKKD